MPLSSDVVKNYDTESVRVAKNEAVSTFEMANSCSTSDVTLLPENSHVMLDSRQNVLTLQAARALGYFEDQAGQNRNKSTDKNAKQMLTKTEHCIPFESRNNSQLAEGLRHRHSELPLAVNVGGVYADGPRSSSSSTDSAESVRDLTSGTKVEILDADGCRHEPSEVHANDRSLCLLSSNAQSHSSSASTKLCFDSPSNASILFAHPSAISTASTSQHPYSFAAAGTLTTPLVAKKNLASVPHTGYRFSDAVERPPSAVYQQQWLPGVAKGSFGCESNSQTMAKHPVNGLIDNKTSMIRVAKTAVETHLPLEHAYAQIPEPGKFF